MLPLFLQLVWALCCPFYCCWLCAVLHTAATVYAAPFSAVGAGVMLPLLLRLAYVLPFILLLGWMLPLSMRLVWTWPCLYNAVGVCVVLYTAARVDAAPYNAVGMDVALPL